MLTSERPKFKEMGELFVEIITGEESEFSGAH